MLMHISEDFGRDDRLCKIEYCIYIKSSWTVKMSWGGSFLSINMMLAREKHIMERGYYIINNARVVIILILIYARLQERGGKSGSIEHIKSSEF